MAAGQLILVPSVFAHKPGPPVSPDGPPLLFYPSRGVATLWAQAPPAASPGPEAADRSCTAVPAWRRTASDTRPPKAVQPVTVTPSGTLPTSTAVPGVPVATVTGTTLFTLVSTTQAIVPAGLKPTA